MARTRLKKTLGMAMALGLAGMAAQASAQTSAQGWKPADGPLMTRWAQVVSPSNTLPEYPRPQMVREHWQNLNGLWDYAITERDADTPTDFDEQILVPFPVESALSGVMKPLSPEQWLWYRRSFEVPEAWDGQRVLLHFEAVDWEAAVTVNGKAVGQHAGGYDPFTFDITDALKGQGPQRVTVRVWDPTGASGEPMGKQSLTPGGIQYTASSGIWQTAWIEPVPKAHIAGMRLTPEVDQQRLAVRVDTPEPGHGQDLRGVAVHARVLDGDAVVSEATGKPGEAFNLDVKKPKLWSPDSPFLYGLELSLVRDGQAIDKVDSYFGMRSASIVKDEKGVNRLGLNGEPLFQFGPLNQDFWPGGLYTAPTDEAVKADVTAVKRYGGNMMRVHVKTGSRRMYYWADKLGVLVWQDMPHHRGADQKQAEFKQELRHIIKTHFNSPSIVMWVPFNEGWGQFDTPQVVEMVQKLDPSRLVDNASGWTDRGAGDVMDIHHYPSPSTPALQPDRAAVLGEFGGLGLPVDGHMWTDKKNWGYVSFKNKQEVTDKYVDLLHRVWLLESQGLSAAVYTQLTDVEVEANGWMTYDREVEKIDPERARRAAERLYTAPPKTVGLVPTARTQPQTWRYTTDKPGEDWASVGLDDGDWQEGKSSFGVLDTPGANVHTAWETPDIWIRRRFDMPKDGQAKDQGRIYLQVSHDDGAEVYINGKRVKKLDGADTSYQFFPLDAGDLLKPKGNVIAVHGHDSGGDRRLDAGLIWVPPSGEADPGSAAAN